MSFFDSLPQTYEIFSVFSEYLNFNEQTFGPDSKEFKGT